MRCAASGAARTSGGHARESLEQHREVSVAARRLDARNAEATTERADAEEPERSLVSCALDGAAHAFVELAVRIREVPARPPELALDLVA